MSWLVVQPTGGQPYPFSPVRYHIIASYWDPSLPWGPWLVTPVTKRSHIRVEAQPIHHVDDPVLLFGLDGVMGESPEFGSMI